MLRRAEKTPVYRRAATRSPVDLSDRTGARARSRDPENQSLYQRLTEQSRILYLCIVREAEKIKNCYDSPLNISFDHFRDAPF